ncbi:hypothetical protein PAQ31011_02404 [Pandoraea aquatica]|uniref:Uncharacterized protein n=1 Tax=Pandoraea aquatica TaxID=2508290 RepID=A0A5E4V2Z3_9BURK|nr:hypothetical protein [Pandoraea aquatica]VVE06173.1 hypothetical protein PAQ31011_02404 [Pandoraea aquatica]
MTNEPHIDTGNLLTILGVIAAVWAIIPANSRLRFRLSVTWPDWGVVIAAFLSVHYLVFEKALREVGLYHSFGPWRWGLDSGSAVYLILLAVGIYLLVRARSPKLAKQNVEIFSKLVDSLLLTKRYDELVSLVEPQLPKLLRLSQRRPPLARMASRMRPKPIIDIEAILRGAPRRRESAVKRYIRSALGAFEEKIMARNRAGRYAKEIIKSISTSPALVAHLAVVHPYFCLRLLGRPEAVREEFIDLFVSALLSDRNSRIFVELKNNQNLNGAHRLSLPESNRILCFFFKDVSVAAQHGLYRAIGEAVCMRLDEDDRMAALYNRSLGYYADVGKYHCPVHAGIKLFEIMIHEGIHQGQQDHLWLFYFTHFTEKILDQMRHRTQEDEYHEWPTPFYYLLYEIISITSNWIEDCTNVKVEDIPSAKREEDGFDVFYISKQATIALGTIMQDIVQSPKLTDQFKTYALEIALRRFLRIANKPRAAEVANDFTTALIVGAHLSTKIEYRRALKGVFDKLDHVLRHQLPTFEKALTDSLQ